jgi:HAMP domain-containing protein
MANIPIGLLDTLTALIAGVIFTLIGIIYRRLKRQIENLENTVDQLESAVLEMKRDIDTTNK